MVERYISRVICIFNDKLYLKKIKKVKYPVYNLIKDLTNNKRNHKNYQAPPA